MLDKRACSFCDMEKETPERLPACTRPPTRKVRGEMFGRAVILDACKYHYDKAPEQDRPNQFTGPVVPDGILAESHHGRRIMMEHLSQERVVELTCRGCGSIIVRNYEREGSLDAATRMLGIDLLIIKNHLDHCDFRRSK